MLDESIPLTTNEYDEWGSPNEEEYYEYILSYCPYDNLERKDYPNILVTTSENRLVLRTYMEAGHGGVSGRYKRYRETAFVYAFLSDFAEIH